MSDKLRSVLTLALRPETGDGEAMAALAARRLAAKADLNETFKTEIREKVVTEGRVVYKEKVVYRPYEYSAYDRTYSYRITVPCTYLHTIIEMITTITYKKGIWLQIVSCKPQNGKIDQPTTIEMKLHGQPSSIDIDFVHAMRRCIEIIKNSDDEDRFCAKDILMELPKRNWFIRFIKHMAEKL